MLHADPHYQAFVAAMMERPDDAPRLVCADWLEEHGGEAGLARAEFIRVQVELAKLPPGDPRGRALLDLESTLLAQHQAGWLGPFAGTEVVFRRGFIERVRIGVRAFLDAAEDIFRFTPLLHAQLLRVSHANLTMTALADSPHVARLRGLSLRGSALGDERLAEFFGRARMSHLEELDLHNSGAGARTFRALRASSFPRLSVLNVSENYAPGALADLLPETDSLPLRSLDLFAMGLGTDDVQALLDWPGLEELEELSLRSNRLGVTRTRLLVESARPLRLHTLDLDDCAVGVNGTRALADAAWTDGLSCLRLRGNAIRPSGVRALVNSPFLKHLEELSLASNQLDEESIRLLAGWPRLGGLRDLDLRGNMLSPAAVEALVTSPHLGELVQLRLAETYIGNRGAQFLAECPRLRSLEILDVRSCGISVEGGRALLGSPHLTNLRVVKLATNQLGRDGWAEVLRRFPEAQQ
jgi:uncharacterized protein (TIGR02996 family)